MGCLWGANRALSGLRVLRRAGQLLRRRSYSVRARLRAWSFRSHAIWLVFLGLRLEGPGIDVQPFRLLHAQPPGGRLGSVAWWASRLLWPGPKRRHARRPEPVVRPAARLQPGWRQQPTRRVVE